MRPSAVALSSGAATPLVGARAGSSRIASTLVHENALSAAARHGSHTYAVCSLGASVMGVSGGTSRPKTCSVLCVTPGAYPKRQCG